MFRVTYALSDDTKTKKMKLRAALLLCLALAAGLAQAADEEKPAAKKAEKAKPAAKSDKNVFQKAESSIGKWAHDNKVWTRSESRGTAQKKPAKKSD
jgi:hypothetical protein